MANVTTVCGNRYENFSSGINKQIKFKGGTALTFRPNCLIGREIGGYAVKLDDTANLRLIGQFAESVHKDILAADSDGANVWDVAQPRFFEAKCNDTLTQASIGWPVYAKYDDEVSILPGTYGNCVGFIKEIVTSTMVLIDPVPYDKIIDPGYQGRRFLADAAYTLLVSELGKTIIMPNTTARTITLPALATVPLGAGYRIVKMGTDTAIITLDGNASETINGATTNTQLATNYEGLELIKAETTALGYEWYARTFT